MSRWTAMVGLAAGHLLLCSCAGNAAEPAAPEPLVIKRHERRAAAEPAREPPRLRLPPNATCERARSQYIQEWKLEGDDHSPPDLSAGQFGMVLGGGRYIRECGVPESVEVSICTAVQHGQALGVTVATSPRAPGIEQCIAKRVRQLEFPSHPRLDVTRTTFKRMDNG